jgi:alpha-L-fucosidase 2
MFMLPALPDVWKQGSVTGLCARGGFEIESMTWTDGKIDRLVLKSKLGGNCRIRSYSPLRSDDHAKLVQAEEENTNPFYVVHQVKKPLVSPQAKLNPVGIRATYLYDLATTAGGKYVITKKL